MSSNSLLSLRAVIAGLAIGAALLFANAPNAAPITRSYAISTPPGPSMPPALVSGQHHPGLEECAAFLANCAVVYPTGRIELTTDPMTGTATLVLAEVSVLPLSIGPSLLNGQPAIDLFLELDGATGQLVGAGAIFDVWGFDLDNGVRIIVSDLFGQSIRIGGGYDHRFVDGPSAWVNLEAVAVPEPSTALMVLGGLTGLSCHRRRSERRAVQDQ